MHRNRVERNLSRILSRIGRFHSRSRTTPWHRHTRLFLDFARSAASRHRRTISATMMYVPTINRMASIMTAGRGSAVDKLQPIFMVAKRLCLHPVRVSAKESSRGVPALFSTVNWNSYGSRVLYRPARFEHTAPGIMAAPVRDGGKSQPAGYPAFALKPAASMPAIAHTSSLSDVSPLTPTAPSKVVPSMIRTPPGTGTRRPCASAFTAPTK